MKIVIMRRKRNALTLIACREHTIECEMDQIWCDVPRVGQQIAGKSDFLHWTVREVWFCQRSIDDDQADFMVVVE